MVPGVILQPVRGAWHGRAGQRLPDLRRHVLLWVDGKSGREENCTCARASVTSTALCGVLRPDTCIDGTCSYVQLLVACGSVQQGLPAPWPPPCCVGKDLDSLHGCHCRGVPAAAAVRGPLGMLVRARTHGVRHRGHGGRPEREMQVDAAGVLSNCVAYICSQFARLQHNTSSVYACADCNANAGSPVSGGRLSLPDQARGPACLELFRSEPYLRI